MSGWIEGEVLGQTRWTDRLLSLRVQAELPAFEAGQFAKLALDIDGERVARPYSFVNAPGQSPHEFYYIVVPGGPLTPRLAALGPGDRIWLGDAPAGFLVLSEVPQAQNLWLLSTGTGIGPFLSILRSEAVWARYDRVVLVHAVREAAELSYRDLIAAIGLQRGARFSQVPVLSRELVAGALPGRIPALLADGRLERAAGCELGPTASQVMLCGNPQMVADTVSTLALRGMRKHRRRNPGQITVENYW